jgi:hypothetical protein
MMQARLGDYFIIIIMLPNQAIASTPTSWRLLEQGGSAGRHSIGEVHG